MAGHAMMTSWTLAGRNFVFDESLPMASTETVAITLGAYLSMVLYGVCSSRPGPAWWTKHALFLHNLFLAFLSLVMAIGITHAVLHEASHHGLMSVFCDASKRHPGFVFWNSLLCFDCHAHSGLFRTIYSWLYVFFLSKVYEFADTALLICEGKSLTVLHWFHHAFTFVLSYVALRTSTTYSFVAMISNSWIHSVMYTYYAFAAVGLKPSWGMVLTKFQMLQFIVNALAMLLWGYLHVTLQTGCSGDWTALCLCMLAMGIYFWLFFQMDRSKSKKK